MKASDHSNRAKRTNPPAAEALETRELLTGGAGNTFSIIPTTIVKEGGTVVVPVTIDSTHFESPKGRVTIGVDVAASQSSSAVPSVQGVTDQKTKMTHALSRTTYNPRAIRDRAAVGSKTTAALVSIRTPGKGESPLKYDVSVRGKLRTKGQVLVGFYLPGDADGNGVVDKNDIQAIKKAFGTEPGSQAYAFEADSNRDGRIGPADLKIARDNKGAKTTISPVISANLDEQSDSGLKDRITNIRDVNFTGSATPGATITFEESTGKVPKVMSSVGADGVYNVAVHLADGAHTFKVTTSDSFGQTISGSIAPVTFSVDAAKSVTGDNS